MFLTPPVERRDIPKIEHVLYIPEHQPILSTFGI